MLLSFSFIDIVYFEENLEDIERYLQLNILELEDGGGIVLLLLVQNVNYYYRNYMYIIFRMEEVIFQYGKFLIYELDEMEIEKRLKVVYGVFYWKESWNIREIRVVVFDIFF